MSAILSFLNFTSTTLLLPLLRSLNFLEVSRNSTEAVRRGMEKVKNAQTNVALLSVSNFTASQTVIRREQAQCSWNASGSHTNKVRHR